jgi:hypothetical protein
MIFLSDILVLTIATVYLMLCVIPTTLLTVNNSEEM